ncbi:MAG: DUF433 domain-containing protein [Acidobacteriaceae bacterium]
MTTHADDVVMGWTDCPLVEINPRKVSGAPILKGTRVQADSIVENYRGGSPIEEISENFGIPEPTIRELLIFAAHQQKHFQP